MRGDKDDDDGSFKFDIVFRNVTLYLLYEIKIKKKCSYLYFIKRK